jgi:hypothetical protein
MFTYSYTFPQVKACENVGEFKEVNPKHSQVKNKLKNYNIARVWNFWDKGAINKHDSNWTYIIGKFLKLRC